mmetsp:Transcript_16884/g.23475  ORF Transcript_16884/g.23475 Transcript_16884/m.23475 type:complete len:159 (-) Transcript_16884:225-701(-)
MKSFSNLPFLALLMQIFLSSTHGFSTPIEQATLATSSFVVKQRFATRCSLDLSPTPWSLKMSSSPNNDDGVVELADDDGIESVKQEAKDSSSTSVAAPFLSQGNELAEGVLNPDLSDPKQTRVIIYIIISLIPVLFLVPLMLGSRDLIPLDAVPPVEM